MPAAAPEDALELFHPVIAEWFGERVGTPTPTQRAAWPRIAGGGHVLVTAPTGSGKTLTAFLWALDRLLTGAWEGGRTRVLYVSPLKALNNDVERNLLAPLAELVERSPAGDEAFCPVRVATRSGDTPASERQKMIRRPPEILITTPESLNLLVTSKGGRSILGGLQTVILDEIHAVVGGKRGTHLITAVERLVALSGEFQRVALSATVRPRERVARFVGGYELAGSAAEPRYKRRRVELVDAAESKSYDLQVVFPPEVAVAASLESSPADEGDVLDYDRASDTLWQRLTGEFKGRIRRNRSTLLFANSRRKVELVTRLLNEDEPSEIAYSHHGSLSREIRAVVEERLKEGRLAAIAATNSLELGIDIGVLDEVILLQTPPTIASAVQRIGRAGHKVGAVSRGRLYPLFGRDFLDAAVVASGVLQHDIEEVRPVRAPLDVLAQVILSMVVAETWQIDELYAALRTSDPYHELTRRQFDLVLEMLAGRYADTRIRELAPRLSIDRVDGTVRARRGTANLVYRAGGTIPDRGYFHLRLADSMAKLGELDEEFVWERSLGDAFTLGAQSWQIVKITHNDVLVRPARRASAMAPFWRAEARNRSFHLSEKIGRFLEDAEELLGSKRGRVQLGERLRSEHAMSEDAAARLLELLERQRAATSSALPHRRHLLVERFSDPSSESGKEQLVLHTFWGGRVNRPLAIALEAAWEERYRQPLEIDSNNDCVIVAVPRGFDVDELLGLVGPDDLEKLLRARLETTGFFGARFRENAGRALLLPRSDHRRRVPLWLNRERAKKLLDAVGRKEDFPIVVETWRGCLQDAFEIEVLARLLAEVAAGEVRVAEARTSTPSPFAAGMIWQQTNRLMYEDDTPEGARAPGVSRSLLRELVFSSQLRPRLPGELVDTFQRKLHRTFPGYAPQSADDLIDWVSERVVLPEREWRELLAAVERDAAAAGEETEVVSLVEAAAERVVRLELPEGVTVIAALAQVERLGRALGLDDVVDRVRPLVAGAEPPPPPPVPLIDDGDDGDDPLAALAGEWVRFYGPFESALLTETFALDDAATRELIDSLVASEIVVVDRFRDSSEADEEPEICDVENLERLLRILRAASRPAIEPRPLTELAPFLAAHQELSASADGLPGLQRHLERLLGYPAAAGLWESDILPARLDPYYPSWLDSAMQESDLLWRGCGRERLTFAFPADLELIAQAEDETEGEEASAEAAAVLELLPDPQARYELEELAASTGIATGKLARRLWQAAWAGEVSNTTFLAVRQGVLNRFKPSTPEPRPARAAGGSRRRGAPGPGRRSGFARWRSTRPFAGTWFRLPAASAEPLDALDREELNKERARLLLERYGVLFRELCARELGPFRWGTLFRSLRLMELSGEVFSGHFFTGIHGLQFASRRALKRLAEGFSRDTVFWLNAADPVSPCGLGLDELRGELPARVPSNHLVYHGAALVLVSRRNGGELEIRVEPEHPHLGDYLGFLDNLLTRQFSPLKAVDVETINGEPAGRSPYAPRLAAEFSVTREVGGLRLRRRY